MREVSAQMRAAWGSGAYVGPNRPTARVLVTRPMMELHETPENTFASLLFGQRTLPKEIPTVRSVNWSRSVDEDTATCEVELLNTTDAEEYVHTHYLGQPGWFTYNRGGTAYSSRWRHEENEWKGLLMPDSMLITFEGYGVDFSLSPEEDPHMVQTGVWLIDEVQMNAGGGMTLTCRDTGRILHDQIVYPPVSPFKAGFTTEEMPDGAYSYPLTFQADVGVDVEVTPEQKRRHPALGFRNYRDYTDIVKLFCAWGGFYWPRTVYHMVGDTGYDQEFYETKQDIKDRIEEIRVNRDLPADDDSDWIWVDRVWGGNWTIGDVRNELDNVAREFHGDQGTPLLRSDGSYEYWAYNRLSPNTGDDRSLTIRVGRVWGDLQQSGTTGIVPLPHNVFEKKPLMDGISYIRDILGFIFHIDEYGGVVFKMPNIFSVGNTIRSLGQFSGNRVTDMVTIDERHTLMDLTSTLSSRNVRERTFVTNDNGTIGHMAAGWNPNPIGLRRMGGYTDIPHFGDPKEAKVMAEMIALRQLFTYRTDRITIPGYPAIQIDDQIRVYEQVTSEGYVHYVKGIQSKIDMVSGEWTYDLETHWLGERPFKKWAFDPDELSAETREYIERLY